MVDHRRCHLQSLNFILLFMSTLLLFSEKMYNWKLNTKSCRTSSLPWYLFWLFIFLHKWWFFFPAICNLHHSDEYYASYTKETVKFPNPWKKYDENSLLLVWPHTFHTMNVYKWSISFRSKVNTPNWPNVIPLFAMLKYLQLGFES